jgi:branched-chain amino acid transport system ATP-binding protein
MLLEGTQMTLSYGGVRALDGVDVSIQKGEVLGIIGPNGAGKTTLFNAISGLVPLAKGQIVFNGRVLKGMSPHRITRLGIARTFQIVKPFSRLTVRENVTIGAFYGSRTRRSMTEAYRVVDTVLQQVGLDSRKNSYARDLSVIEQKKLELARALATNAQLILLDEVMAGLGTGDIDRLSELLISLKKEGYALMVVEHVMRAVMTISDRVIVLHHGQKIAEGTPELISRDDTVIAAYLGERYAKAKEARG